MTFFTFFFTLGSSLLALLSMRPPLSRSPAASTSAAAAMRTSRTVLSICASLATRNGGGGRESARGLSALVASPTTFSSTSTAAVASLFPLGRRRFSSTAVASLSSSSSSHYFSESEEDDELSFYRIRDRARKQEKKTTRVPKAKGAAGLRASGALALSHSPSSSSSSSSSSSPPLPPQPRLAFDALRPTYADVDSISRGGPSSKNRKGTGSRRVPHRLDAEERMAFDAARRREGLSPPVPAFDAAHSSSSSSSSSSASPGGGGGGGFVSLRGSGYRAGRKGAPLANIWRQWCDVAGLPAVALMRGGGGDPRDTVVADFSTLRLPRPLAAALASGRRPAAAAATAAETATASLPPPPSLPEALSSLAREHGMRQLSEGEAASACPFTHEARPRALLGGAGGGGESGVSESGGSEEEPEVDLAAAFVPIWQLLPWPLFAFEGDRAGARALASALSDREGEVGRISRGAVEGAARGREEAAAEAKRLRVFAREKSVE